MVDKLRAVIASPMTLKAQCWPVTKMRLAPEMPKKIQQVSFQDVIVVVVVIIVIVVVIVVVVLVVVVL